MSDLVEKVAKALCAEDCQTWSELDAVGIAYWSAQAHVAIAVVLEEAARAVGNVAVSNSIALETVTSAKCAAAIRALADAKER